jgi:hypothetical protein
MSARRHLEKHLRHFCARSDLFESRILFERADVSNDVLAVFLFERRGRSNEYTRCAISALLFCLGALQWVPEFLETRLS